MKNNKANYWKYLNLWLFWMIMITILIFETGSSKACPEDKITWILIEVIIFMFSYKFWEDKSSLLGTREKKMEQYELDELAEKYRNVKCNDNGENLKDYIKHKLETQRKELIEEFVKDLNYIDGIEPSSHVFERVSLMIDKWKHLKEKK